MSHAAYSGTIIIGSERIELENVSRGEDADRGYYALVAIVDQKVDGDLDFDGFVLLGDDQAVADNNLERSDECGSRP